MKENDRTRRRKLEGIRMYTPLQISISSNQTT